MGAAVLIRALEPLAGLERMRARGAGRGPVAGRRELCSGPGKLTQALGVALSENGVALASGPVRVSAATGEWPRPPLHAARASGSPAPSSCPGASASLGEPQRLAPAPARAGLGRPG